MITHIFLPTLDLEGLPLLDEHAAWLTNWLKEIESNVEGGSVAASLCLQGAIGETILYGETQTDWVGVMDEFLVRENRPLAYSEEFGKRLYKFAFWEQTEVHAVHARRSVEQLCGTAQGFDYAALIEELIQPSGWIYNPSVSPTGIRTRMKSEYLMSLAMGIEILAAHDRLADKKLIFEGVISAENLTNYLSAEYFRLRSLEILDSANLLPANLESVLQSCEIGEGYCDFDVKGKVDDYMGTAKRIGRDVTVHSALSALHALAISSACDEESKNRVKERVRQFANHIRNNPLDIPPFKMREIDVPFGTGLSPLEVIAASGIVHYIGSQ